MSFSRLGQEIMEAFGNNREHRESESIRETPRVEPVKQPYIPLKAAQARAMTEQSQLAYIDERKQALLEEAVAQIRLSIKTDRVYYDRYCNSDLRIPAVMAYVIDELKALGYAATRVRGYGYRLPHIYVSWREKPPSIWLRIWQHWTGLDAFMSNE